MSILRNDCVAVSNLGVYDHLGCCHLVNLVANITPAQLQQRSWVCDKYMMKDSDVFGLKHVAHEEIRQMLMYNVSS